MNGIVPPTPMYIASRRSTPARRAAIARSSHGAIAGAFQPPWLDSTSNSTFAPYGGSLSSAFLTARGGGLRVDVGGKRNDSFSAVYGRSTFPAFCSDGMPSAPVTASVGRHVLLSSSSYGSFAIGRVPAANGNLPCTLVAEHLRRGPRLLQPILLESCTAGHRSACAGLARPRRAQAGGAHAEARRHDAAGHARMHAFGEHVDAQRADEIAAQRSRAPELIVVAALRIETHDQRRLADAIGQRDRCSAGRSGLPLSSLPSIRITQRACGMFWSASARNASSEPNTA